MPSYSTSHMESGLGSGSNQEKVAEVMLCQLQACLLKARQLETLTPGTSSHCTGETTKESVPERLGGEDGLL